MSSFEISLKIQSDYVHAEIGIHNLRKVTDKKSFSDSKGQGLDKYQLDI